MWIAVETVHVVLWELNQFVCERCTRKVAIAHYTSFTV